MDEYQLFRDQHDRNSKLLWGDGNHRAPVMLVGMGPDSKAQAPFTMDADSELRVINHFIGVIPSLCYYNYLLKAPTSMKNPLQMMKNILDREINSFCKPRAVILFGQGVLSEITGTKTSLNEYRRTRLYSTHYPDVSFFSTYDMSDVIASDNTGQSLRQKVSDDLQAVYETDTDYFIQTRRF